MSKYHDVDSLIREIKGDLDKFKEQTLKVLNEEVDRAMDDAAKEFGVYQQQKITEIFKNAVAEFYGAYTPKSYERQGRDGTGGLYNVLDLHTDEHGMVITGPNGYQDLFDSSQMHGDRNGGDLFNKVFMEGWHGGAESISEGKTDIWGTHPSQGTPYYRKPGFVRYPNPTKTKWHKYGKWGKVAKRTTAPYTIIEEKLKVAEGAEIFKKFKDISQRHNDKAVKKVEQEEIPRIYSEIFE